MDYLNLFLKNENNNINAVGDYSYEEEIFNYKHKLESDYHIETIIITYEDTNLTHDKYGYDTEMKNGLIIYYTTKAGVVRKFIIGKDYPIKTNSDWFYYSCSVENKSFNLGHTLVRVKFQFSEPITISQEDEIGVVLLDDFSKIKSQRFHIEGYLEK